MDITATYTCAHCGEENVTTVDLSAGSRQEYTEDCQVCCRPNALTVEFDHDGTAYVTARRE